MDSILSLIGVVVQRWMKDESRRRSKRKQRKKIGNERSKKSSICWTHIGAFTPEIVRGWGGSRYLGGFAMVAIRMNTVAS